jgi:hypothetical protein
MIRKISSYTTAIAAAGLAAGYAVVFAFAMTARSGSFEAEEYSSVAAAYYSFIFEMATSHWAYVAAAGGAVLAAAIALFLFPPATAKPALRRILEIRIIGQAVLAASLVVLTLETLRLTSQTFLFWEGNPRILAGGVAQAGWAWMRDCFVLFASWVAIWAIWSARKSASSLTELSAEAVVSISALALVVKVAIIAMIRDMFTGGEPQYFLPAAAVAGAQLLILFGVLRLRRRQTLYVAEEAA